MAAADVFQIPQTVFIPTGRAVPIRVCLPCLCQLPPALRELLKHLRQVRRVPAQLRGYIAEPMVALEEGQNEKVNVIADGLRYRYLSLHHRCMQW